MSKSKLKSQSVNTKLSKKQVEEKTRGGNCQQYPAFSFLYLTTNKRYTFDYFGKSKQEKLRVRAELHDRLETISQKSWRDWISDAKGVGFETLNFDILHVAPKGISLTPDENIYVFRFDKQDKRIIGFRKDECPILYIFAYDFDHSAYPHS